MQDPRFREGEGAIVYIDGAHHNGHTMDGSYRPLAELLRRDGYVVRSWPARFTDSLPPPQSVLVVANAGETIERVDSVVTHTGSAFTAPAEARPLLRYPATMAFFPGRRMDGPGESVDGQLQAAALEAGHGRIAVFAEAGMFRILTPAACGVPVVGQNARLARNVVFWLAQRERAVVRPDAMVSPSPDGRLLAYVDWDTGDVAVRELASGRAANRLEGDGWRAERAASSQDEPRRR